MISALVYLFVTPFRRTRDAVFVYHSVDELSASRDPCKMNVPVALFERQMGYLSRLKNNYTVTFDDGFEGVYKNAFPIIKKYGIKAMVFLTTDFLDGKMRFDRFFGAGHSAAPLEWGQVREMHSSGIKIGSHSISHPDMASLDGQTAYREAAASRERIESLVGADVKDFSYPFGNPGSFNKDTAAILKTAGYEKGYTNVMGMENSRQDPFAIRRIRVYGTDNMPRFRLKVSGAYNWVDRLVALVPRGNSSYK
jgi:peptidoglycan/xylan/chitin deacetylase (PgdA/CDA1 family)